MAGGIGQTFRPQEPLLVDGSLLLTDSPDSRIWWQNARLEVRSGSPVHLDGGSSLLFQSAVLDVADTPVVGTAFNGANLRELKLSDVGFNIPLPVTVGAIYSLLLVNYDNDNTAFYAAKNPGDYPDGVFVNYSRSTDKWNQPDPAIDMAFRIITAPEPALIGLLTIASIGMLCLRNRTGK